MGNGESTDKNGHVYVRLGWREYIKLMGAGLAVTAAFSTVAVNLSGINAHMQQDEIHQDRQQKRALALEVTEPMFDALGKRIDDRSDALEKQVNAGFEAMRREMSLLLEAERSRHEDIAERIRALENNQ